MTKTSQSIPLRYIHHKLPENRIISIGFTVPENKQGKMIMAFAFCSEQDNFSRKKARSILHSRINNNHPKVIEAEQKLGEHINDAIARIWNENKVSLTPVKWKQTGYPNGVTMERVGADKLAGKAG